MLAKLYLPALKKQLIVYPIFVVCYIALLTLLSCIFPTGDFPSPIMIFPITLLFYLAPVSLTRWNYYPISRQLPVKTSEKIVFLIGYYWILMFLLTEVLATLCLLASFFTVPSFHEMVMGYANEIQELSPVVSHYLPMLIVSNIFSAFIYQLPTLYGVLTKKQNRAFYGLLWGFGTLVVFSFFCGIVGGVIGIISVMGWYDENGTIPDSPDLIIEHMIPNILDITIIVTIVVSLALLLIFGSKIIKRLRTGGF